MNNVKKLLVKDLLKKDVITVSPLANLRETMKIMKENNIKSIVVDKTHPEDAYGILTYTDILKTVVAEDGDIEVLSVYDLYTKPAISVSQFLAVRYAAKMMISQDIKRLLAVDNNELVGLLSMSDIIEAILTEHV